MYAWMEAGQRILALLASLSTVAFIGVTVVPMDQNLLTIQHATKVYSSRGADPIVAFKDISLTLGVGEFVSLLGPSGCGKSTLLRCIAGLEPVTTGSILFRDRPVRSPPPGLGVVFQRDILLDWRTILDNVLITVEFLGLRRSDYVDKAMALLALYGLAGFERRYPWELSGGMRQRAAICRALVDEPAFLLMDEPFGALDALTRDQLNVELQDRWMMDKKTVLFITHGISEAVFLSDRVIVMDRHPGRIAREFAIDMKRPRPLSVRDSSEFIGYSAEIRDVIAASGAMRIE
jgi:NitT/TauT family transport system ATP-binding protein